MGKYILFDKLCETSYSAPFVTSAKELLKKLDIKIALENSFKKDLGFKIKAVNVLAFHTANAYNLSIAANDGLEIVCADDSSLLSLNDTKEALNTDENLASKIRANLGIELNTNTKILHINELLNTKEISELIKAPFSNFNAAIFQGPDAKKLEKLTDIAATCNLLDKTKVSIVKTSTCKDSDGYEIKEANKVISKRLAGTVLLDAFDNAADFLVVNDVRSFSFLDGEQKSIAKEMGRDIDLPLLTPSQILLLALGVNDASRLGLDTHKVKVTLI